MILKGRGFQRVREISFSRFRVEQGQRFLAAKRRKNAAHGASRGYMCELIQPQRGERGVLAAHPSTRAVTHEKSGAEGNFSQRNGLSAIWPRLQSHNLDIHRFSRLAHAW
jgi:hypothetical protein